LGVSLCGENHPAVYAKAIAAIPTTAVMIANGHRRKAFGGVGDGTIRTYFLANMGLRPSQLCWRLPQVAKLTDMIV
jgi:hypothetical protein